MNLEEKLNSVVKESKELSKAIMGVFAEKGADPVAATIALHVTAGVCERGMKYFAGIDEFPAEVREELRERGANMAMEAEPLYEALTSAATPENN